MPRVFVTDGRAAIGRVAAALDTPAASAVPLPTRALVAAMAGRAAAGAVPHYEQAWRGADGEAPVFLRRCEGETVRVPLGAWSLVLPALAAWEVRPRPTPFPYVLWELHAVPNRPAMTLQGPGLRSASVRRVVFGPERVDLVHPNGRLIVDVGR